MSPARRARGLPRGAVALGGTARRVRLPGGEVVSRRTALRMRGIVPEALAGRPRRPQRIGDIAGRDQRAYGDVIFALGEMRGGLALSATLDEINAGRPRGQRLTAARLRALAGPAVRSTPGGRWRAAGY